MTRPYSEDLRERALLLAAPGETIRAIGTTLARWWHRKRVLAGETADWLQRAHPVGSAAELAARGIWTHPKAVWVFVHAEGLSFKKNRARGRAGQARHRPQADALESPSGPDRSHTPRLHRPIPSNREPLQKDCHNHFGFPCDCMRP